MKSSEARSTLPAAEAEMAKYLNQLNLVEASLRVTAPSDPKRGELKRQKEIALTHYRATKERVKELRRNGGATPEASPAQRAAMAVLTDGAVLQKLYVAVAEVRDRDRRDGDAGSFLTPGEREAIDDFLDAWES
jgi:hypothetical protein